MKKTEDVYPEYSGVSPGIQRLIERQARLESAMKIGARVQHDSFGLGTITHIADYGLCAVLTIDFTDRPRRITSQDGGHMDVIE